MVVLSKEELLDSIRGREFGDAKVIEGIAIPSFVPKHWWSEVEYMGRDTFWLKVCSDWIETTVPWDNDKKVKCQIRWTVDYFTHEGQSKRVEIDTLEGMPVTDMTKLAEYVILRNKIDPHYRSGNDFCEYYHLINNVPIHHVVLWHPGGFAESFEEEMSLANHIKIIPSVHEAYMYPFLDGWNRWDKLDTSKYDQSNGEYLNLESKLREKLGLFRYKRSCAFCGETPCCWVQNEGALLRDNDLTVGEKTVKERVEFLHMQLRLSLREEWDSEVSRSSHIPLCCSEAIKLFEEERTDDYNRLLSDEILSQRNEHTLTQYSQSSDDDYKTPPTKRVRR